MSATEKEIEAETTSNDNSHVDLENNAAPKLEERDTVDGDENRTEYLSGLRLGLIVLGLCLAVLLVGLVSITRQRRWSGNTDRKQDNSILATVGLEYTRTIDVT